jgi:hypothetical protein
MTAIIRPMTAIIALMPPAKPAREPCSVSKMHPFPALVVALSVMACATAATPAPTSPTASPVPATPASTATAHVTVTTGGGNVAPITSAVTLPPPPPRSHGSRPRPPVVLLPS